MFLWKSPLGVLEFVRKNFLERFKSSLRHLQIMVGRKHNLHSFASNFSHGTEYPVCFPFPRTIFDFGRTLSDVRSLFWGLSAFSRKENGFHCFCVCSPAISHKIMDHFMNEIIDGIIRFWKFSHLLHKMFSHLAYLFKHKANECRKILKQSYGDKKELV